MASGETSAAPGSGVSLSEVRYRYRRREVLRGVTWQVGPGVTGLIGPNGAGKTTLLRVLVGVARPSSGRVEWVSGHAPRIGFLSQRFSVVGEMKLLDTVVYAAWINGVPRARCLPHAQEALEKVGLADRAGARCGHLSGGQRQRLGIAASLAHDPELLVLDEPTVGLDPEQRLNLRHLIAELGQARPVVLSTHLMEDVQQTCGRVAVLHDGELLFEGATGDLESTCDPQATGAGSGSTLEKAYVQLLRSRAETRT